MMSLTWSCLIWRHPSKLAGNISACNKPLLQIDKELDYLIEEEIITEQVEPTPWVSSVTFPRKPNGEVRVCLDPSNLNKAIIRELHKPMTVEKIAHELAGATMYTKADALKAFLQIHLTHEASLLRTFNSHQG